MVPAEMPNSAGDTRDAGSVPGSGRSPAGGHGHPLQYPRPEDPTDRGAWQADSEETGGTQHARPVGRSLPWSLCPSVLHVQVAGTSVFLPSTSLPLKVKGVMDCWGFLIHFALHFITCMEITWRKYENAYLKFIIEISKIKFSSVLMKNENKIASL